jgi:hypothetical protein
VNVQSFSQAGRRGFDPRLPLESFQGFIGFHLQALDLVYLENPDLQFLLQRFFERRDRLPPALAEARNRHVRLLNNAGHAMLNASLV